MTSHFSKKQNMPPVALTYAQEFYHGLKVLKFITTYHQAQFLDDLASDAAKIGVALATADGTPSIQESLELSIFLQFPRLSPVEKKEFEDWDLLDPLTKDQLVAQARSLLGAVSHLKLDSLKTPDYVRGIADEQKDPSILEQYAAGLFRFAQRLVKADGTISETEQRCLEDIWTRIHGTPAPDGNAVKGEQEDESLDVLIARLHALIGLHSVKQEVQSFVNFLKVQSERRARGMALNALTLHAVFVGPPGTGKTTVARLYAKILKALGFLAKGHLIEVDRAALVGAYMGETSKKTDEKIGEALDGILFIDEAYALVPQEGQWEYGREALDILVKRMEDHRERMAVIAAGYQDEMQRFLDANPGLRSRVAKVIVFESYGPEELLAIFEKFTKDSQYVLSSEAKSKLGKHLQAVTLNADRSFGNARYVRGLFEQSLQNQANRIAGITPLTDELLITLRQEDIPNG